MSSVSARYGGKRPSYSFVVKTGQNEQKGSANVSDEPLSPKTRKLVAAFKTARKRYDDEMNSLLGSIRDRMKEKEKKKREEKKREDQEENQSPEYVLHYTGDLLTLHISRIGLHKKKDIDHLMGQKSIELRFYEFYKFLCMVLLVINHNIEEITKILTSKDSGCGSEHIDDSGNIFRIATFCISVHHLKNELLELIHKKGAIENMRFSFFTLVLRELCSQREGSWIRTMKLGGGMYPDLQFSDSYGGMGIVKDEKNQDVFKIVLNLGIMTSRKRTKSRSSSGFSRCGSFSY